MSARAFLLSAGIADRALEREPVFNECLSRPGEAAERQPERAVIVQRGAHRGDVPGRRDPRDGDVRAISRVCSQAVGLHARPATNFVELAKQFKADIHVGFNGHMAGTIRMEKHVMTDRGGR